MQGSLPTCLHWLSRPQPSEPSSGVPSEKAWVPLRSAPLAPGVGSLQQLHAAGEVVDSRTRGLSGQTVRAQVPALPFTSRVMLGKSFNLFGWINQRASLGLSVLAYKMGLTGLLAG